MERPQRGVDPDASAQRFVPLRRQLLRQAAGLLVLAAITCAGVLLALDPPLTGDAGLKAAVFAVVMGAVGLHARWAHLPRASALPPLPAGVRIDAPTDVFSRRLLAWSVVAVVLGVVLAWIFDDPAMAVAALGGHWLGSVAANVIAAVRVGRWEAAHGRVVIASEGGQDGDAPSPRLFAELPS